MAPWGPQLFRFLVSGGAATATHAGILWASTRLGLPAVPANTIAFLVAVGVTYVGQRYWVFRVAPTSFARFASVVGMGLALQTGGMWALLALGIPMWWAWLCLTVSVPVFTYLAMRLWAFHDSDGAQARHQRTR